MINLVKANKKLSEQILDYYIRNREFLAPFESKRNDNFFTLSSIDLLLKNAIKNEKNGTGVRFYITLDNKVIGTIAPKRKQTAIICLILYSECKGMKIF